MMKSGIQYNQGDIVLVPFPFSDLSAIKQRPVLVLSNNFYNLQTQDIITCAITSNLQVSAHSISIDNSKLKEGNIPVESRIKIDKLFTLKQTLIRKKVAAVNKEVLDEVKNEFRLLV